MTDPPHPGQDAVPGSPPRMPRWVKLTAAIVVLLAAVLVVLMLIGVGGQHGPGRHSSDGGPLPVAVTAGQRAL